jgi:hypothetical protein
MGKIVKKKKLKPIKKIRRTSKNIIANETTETTEELSDEERPTNIVCFDWQRRTCIEVSRGKLVKFIKMETPGGLTVGSMTPILFDHNYKPLPTYSVKKACEIYIGFGKLVGASSEALSLLKTITTISEEDEQIMKSRGNTTTATAGADKGAGKVKQPKEKKHNASNAFRDLILAGKKTDEEIFLLVQKEFGLDDNKRWYVGWYRHDMKKKGIQVPEPIKTIKPDKKAKDTKAAPAKAKDTKAAPAPAKAKDTKAKDTKAAPAKAVKPAKK